ncbi:MAG: hypothetical protein J5872_05850 [Lachnospiraceae bacterium]|nr:hypothetical protein [Lachnospiraceae bacterium]
MNWGWTFLIALLWIVGTSFLYGVIEVLDKRYHFQSQEGFAGLGRWLCRILLTLVPPILFLVINLSIRIGMRFGVFWGIVSLVMEIVFVPLCFFLKTVVLSPERLAKKARIKLGDYRLFEENFYRENPGKPDYEGKAPFAYFANQFYEVSEKIFLSHFFCSKKRRKRYAEAVIENNRDVLPEITRWDYYDDPKLGNGYDSVLLLCSGDTEERYTINRDSLPLFLWIILKRFIKFFPVMVLGFFVKIGKALNPFRWFKKKQE